MTQMHRRHVLAWSMLSVTQKLENVNVRLVLNRMERNVYAKLEKHLRAQPVERVSDNQDPII